MNFTEIVQAQLGDMFRAALILAMISGFQVMRQTIGLSALAKAKEADLVELLGGVFDRLIEPGRS